MATFKDLTGQVFNRLTVLNLQENKNTGNRYRKYWLCLCECGKEKIVRTDCLLNKQVQSCGCLRIEKSKINVIKNHKHKHSRTRVYGIWQKMKDRCYNKNVRSYKNYGARGISVCEDWLIPENFISWAKNNGYKDNLTIDRIDNDGNYCPENCKWSDSKQQARNRTSNILVDYEGKTLTLIELSEKTGITYSCLNARYHRGDRGNRLIRPVRK